MRARRGFSARSLAKEEQVVVLIDGDSAACGWAVSQPSEVLIFW